MPSNDQDEEDSGGNDESEFSRQHALELALSERDLASEAMSLQERIEREEVKRKESVQRTVSTQPNKKTTSLVVQPTASEDDEETLANARRQAVDLALKEEKQAAANPGGGTPTQTAPADSERPRPTRPAVVNGSSRRRRLAQQQGNSSFLRSFRRSSGRLFDTARRRWRGKSRREAMAHDTAASPGAVKVRGVDYEGGECPSDDEMDYLDGSSMCVFNCQDTTVTLAGDSPDREQPQSAPTNQPKEDPPSTTTVGAKQKKVALALIAIVVLLLAALGIGLGIFLSGDDNDDENTETTSPSVTMSPTLDHRMENLRMRLSPISGSTLDDLSSVQYETLSWLFNEDEVDPDLPFVQLKQRYIVALLYFATGGDNWTDPHNFLSTGSVCEWTHAGKGVVCNADDTVVGIFLSGIGLQGSIPFELFLLESLESLDLSENLDLVGSLPGVQVVSSALTQLIIFSCSLAGTIPESLASIPSLEWLDLRSNNLEGSVPAFTNSLEVLRLSGNQLSGDVETLLSSEKENLWVLDLAGNRLSGTIPVGIGSATALQVVYLGTTSSYSNQFSGPIPSEFGGLTALQQLYIGHNSFSNVIPTELGSLSALEYLAMGHAQLSGPLPSHLGLLTSLRYLDVSSNELTGPLPSELGNLSNLESAYFDSNEIDGSVPDSFAALSLLNILHLHGNDITGDLSPVFCEGSFSINNFISDCSPPEEVLCSCCSKCCDTDGANCQ